jgi:hypothetical protein
MTTSLYRHFDKDGRLLYVGISKNAVARLGGHRGKSWYHEIEAVKIERHKSREHALYAEALAIQNEQPLYNLAKPVPRDPDAPPPPPPEPRVEAPDPSKIVAKAKAQCAEPFRFIGPERRIGYICRARSSLNRGIRDLRRAGVPDDLMFIDVVDYGGADQPNMIRAIKTAQHAGTAIICDWPEEFGEALPILKRRGVSVRGLSS